MQNYKDIQVDLTNCDKEPIHIICRIQPHGFLLVVNRESLLIEQVSQNISEFLPTYSTEELLGKPLQVLLSENDNFSHSKLLPQSDRIDVTIISIAGRKFFAFNHLSEGRFILECEPYTAYPDLEKLRDYQQLSQLHSRLSMLATEASMGELSAKAVGEILDYDRVSIMQFDNDWHTKVIAESRQGSQSSYLGHHFPATDIPEPARALLLEKPVRQIVNVNAQAIDIIPYYNPSTATPTSIIRSELRNPSEIHLEYLNNMGVAATLSFSILVKGKLWGIIACQNTKPVFINVWKRQVCALISQSLADTIAAATEKRDIRQYQLFKENEQAFVAGLRKHIGLLTGLSQNSQGPLCFTEGTGAALLLKQKAFVYGLTPSASQISSLMNWLALHTNQMIFNTQELSKDFPEAAAYKEVASGLLALEISRDNQEYLLLFKPEIKETRVWAGNPDKKAFVKGMRLHPRKSFENWEEVVKGKSLPWSLNDVEIAQQFVRDLTNIQLSNQAAKLENLNTKLETTAELLALKNSQLRDFALIMAHNLRSPLANIEGLHNFYRSSPNEENMLFVMDRIQEIAGNMSETISDLNSILKPQMQKQLPFEEVELEKIIEKEVQSLGAVIAEADADITTELQVPTLQLPKVYIESIMHNFISNALKYRSPHRGLVVLVRSWQESNQVHLAVSDNGLGMDMEKVGDKIFGLYKTFHKHEQAKGLGLYLTKLHVESLGGQVAAQSELDQGTTFTVTFPIRP